MKASELRIGNIVEQGIIELIVSSLIQVRDTIYESEVIEPIPLTEEWLLKFGFDFSIDTWYLKGFAIWETECGDKKGNEYMGFFYELREVGMMDREIKYVHELQNLHFALTGEEL